MVDRQGTPRTDERTGRVINDHEPVTPGACLIYDCVSICVRFGLRGVTGVAYAIAADTDSRQHRLSSKRWLIEFCTAGDGRKPCDNIFTGTTKRNHYNKAYCHAFIAHIVLHCVLLLALIVG